MTEEARFLNKKSGGPNLDSMGLNYVQNEVFLEFGSLVFLEILYNDTMSLTNLVEVKHKLNFCGPNFFQASQNWYQN